MAVPTFIKPTFNNPTHASMRDLFKKSAEHAQARGADTPPIAALPSYVVFPSLDKVVSKAIGSYISDSYQYQKLLATKAKNQKEFASFSIEVKSKLPFADNTITAQKTAINDSIKKSISDKIDSDLDQLKLKLLSPDQYLISELGLYCEDAFQKDVFYGCDRYSLLFDFQKKALVAHDTHRVKTKERLDKEKKEEAERAAQAAKGDELFARLGDDPQIAKQTFISLIDERIALGKNSKEPAQGRQQAQTPPQKGKGRDPKPNPPANFRGRGRGRGRGGARGRGRSAPQRGAAAAKARKEEAKEEEKEKEKRKKGGRAKNRGRGRGKL